MEARLKWDSRPKQEQDTKRYAILINKTNRHNSLVTRVPASSSVKGAVRFILVEPLFSPILPVYFYVKKRPFTKAQTQFKCCHTYIKFLNVGVHFFRTKNRKTFVAGGERRRNGCIRMVRPWSNSFRFIDNWRSYTHHAV